MAKTGKFIHKGEWLGDVGLTTSYAASGAGLPIKVNQSEAYGEGITYYEFHYSICIDD